jgi:hypothetical protein
MGTVANPSLGHTSRSCRASKLLLAACYVAVLEVWPLGKASAIVLNNNVAPDTAAVANIYDSANTFPSVVWVGLPGGGGCTGTLINARTVLTGAHCFWNDETNSFESPGSISIKFGPDARVPTRFDTSAIGLSLEPNWRSFLYPNDLAVVTLSTPVTAIRPIPLGGLNDPTPKPGSLLKSTFSRSPVRSRSSFCQRAARSRLC